MAVAVIVGLSFATVLTLVLVPVLYSLVDDFAAFFRRHYTRPEEPKTAEPPVPGPYEPRPAREPREREPVVVREGLRPAEG